MIKLYFRNDESLLEKTMGLFVPKTNFIACKHSESVKWPQKVMKRKKGSIRAHYSEYSARIRGSDEIFQDFFSDLLSARRTQPGSPILEAELFHVQRRLWRLPRRLVGGSG